MSTGKPAGGIKGLVGNKGYSRCLAASEGGGCAVRRDFCFAHQPDDVGAGRGAALPQSADGAEARDLAQAPWQAGRRGD